MNGFACKAVIVAFLGTTNPGHVVSIPAAKLANYTDAQIEWAKQCARRHRIRWKIVND